MPGTVLIADDDPLLSVSLRPALVRSGYREVGEATDGLSAVARAAALQPDIVILDQVMPDIGGTDVIHAIRAAAPNSDVVIYTAYDIRLIRDIASRNGAAAVLAKGRPISELITVLDDLTRQA